jgi:putative CocE/NonD family hydrolase
MTDYQRFRSLNGRRDLHYLRADSADHGGYRLEHLGLGDAANPYLNDEAQTAAHAAESAAIIEFFDACLKGSLGDIPRARWHLGHVGWRTSDEWPPPGVTSQTLFLSPAGAGQVPGPGRLTPSADASRRTVEWIHDPAGPVPSTTSCEENWTFLAADPDDRALADRADVLSFRTEPLTGPVDIAGSSQARLNVEFSSATSHIFCVLHDIFPDGRVLPVAHSAVFVDARARDEYLLVDLDPIAYRFQPGHQIQLQVGSSDFPWVLPHPGTEENPWFAKTVRATRQRLSCGGSAPSSLTLPVLENR